MLEQGPDFWCWFNKTQFSYHCVDPIHAKMFSIQMLLHFRQIVPRVCTLVLFIIIVIIIVGNVMNRMKNKKRKEFHGIYIIIMYTLFTQFHHLVY